MFGPDQALKLLIHLIIGIGKILEEFSNFADQILDQIAQVQNKKKQEGIVGGESSEEKYEAFLKKVPLLATMDDYERTQISEAFKDCNFAEGQTIIKEGDEGRDMFFLVEGKAFASKVLNPGQEPTVVKNYTPGDYFGELALLRNEPRAANIIAASDCSCVQVDRHSFKRMLGPLNDILKRNSELYTKYQRNTPKDLTKKN